MQRAQAKNKLHITGTACGALFFNVFYDAPLVNGTGWAILPFPWAYLLGGLELNPTRELPTKKYLH